MQFSWQIAFAVLFETQQSQLICRKMVHVCRQATSDALLHSQMASRLVLNLRRTDNSQTTLEVGSLVKAQLLLYKPSSKMSDMEFSVVSEKHFGCLSHVFNALLTAVKQTDDRIKVWLRFMLPDAEGPGLAH